MKIPQEQIIIEFQKKILTWYHEHQRDLPWRQTRNPYYIFISEVMSQQTQITRVVPKYETWIETLPTITSLANAPVAQVLQLWSGLGYNRRALNLKKAAEIIDRDFDGKFPQKEEQLLSLPGVGQYTARAILCFAFDQQVAVVDTNVRKVIVTQFLKEESLDNPKTIQAIAEQLVPKRQAYEWNQALMDYAGTVLKKEKISIPKQSKFIGSHRYYRGQILKVLLAKKQVSIKDIGVLIKKDYTISEKEWLEKLLDELIEEGFIINTKGVISLSV